MTLVLQAQSKSLVRFNFCQHPLPISPASDNWETKQDSCVTVVSLLRTLELPGYHHVVNFMSCQTELGPTVCPLVLNCMAWGPTCHANTTACHKSMSGGTALLFQGILWSCTPPAKQKPDIAYREGWKRAYIYQAHPGTQFKELRWSGTICWLEQSCYSHLFTGKTVQLQSITCLSVGILERKAAKGQRKVDEKHDQLGDSFSPSILEVSRHQRAQEAKTK